MTVLRHLLPLALLLAATTTRVDAADVDDSNANLWMSYIGDHPVSGPWGVHLETQVRRSDFGDGWQQVLIRPGLNYTLNSKVSFSGGYCFVETFPYGDYPAKDSFPEQRVWEQVVVKVPALGLTWVNRLRLEQRYIGVPELTPDGGYQTGYYRYENRIRYMLRTAVPLGKKSRYQFIVWDEVFFNFGSNVSGNDFDQNRIFVGFGRDMGKGFRIEAGFMEQTIQRRGGQIQENNHTLALYLISNAPFGGQGK